MFKNIKHAPIYTNLDKLIVYLSVKEKDDSKALIAVISYSHYTINNEAKIHFNQHKRLDNDLEWYSINTQRKATWILHYIFTQ